jgi:hypothetical protein
MFLAIRMIFIGSPQPPRSGRARGDALPFRRALDELPPQAGKTVVLLFKVQPRPEFTESSFHGLAHLFDHRFVVPQQLPCI